jgi:uncharacterized membrane protein
MKKQFSVLPAIFAAFLFAVTSCGDKNDTPPKTKTQLLTQGSWKFKSAVAAGTDFSSALQSCQKDNIYTFNTNGSGNANEGATKCAGTDPDNTPFTWAFVNNETEMTISTPLFTNGATTFTLVSLTEAELVVQMPYNPPVGASVLVTVTFMH